MPPPQITKLPFFSEAYEKPSLSSMTGTVVASGENVKLQCFSKVNFEAFILIKNNGSHTFQEQSSTPQDRGAQAIFLLSQVSSAQAGTYRCCGVFNKGPHVWSQPSNQVQLQVKGEDASPFIPCPLLEAVTIQFKQHLGKEDSRWEGGIRREAVRPAPPHPPSGKGPKVTGNLGAEIKKTAPLPPVLQKLLILMPQSPNIQLVSNGVSVET